jgi:hypothetical protein
MFIVLSHEIGGKFLQMSWESNSDSKTVICYSSMRWRIPPSLYIPGYQCVQAGDWQVEICGNIGSHPKYKILVIRMNVPFIPILVFLHTGNQSTEIYSSFIYKEHFIFFVDHLDCCPLVYIMLNLNPVFCNHQSVFNLKIIV